MRVGRGITALTLLVALGACGAGDKGEAPRKDTSTADGGMSSTSAPQAPPAVSSSAPESTSSSTDASSDSTTDDPTDSSETSPRSPVVTDGSQSLSLEQAIDAGDWRDGQFDPAAATMGPQRAIGVELLCSYGDEEVAQVIDFRLSDVSGNLEVEVAQDVRSESTESEVEFSLEVDGQRTDVKNVEFKGKATLKASLQSAAVVKVGARQIPDPEDGGCDEGVTAVITRMDVTGE